MLADGAVLTEHVFCVENWAVVAVIIPSIIKMVSWHINIVKAVAEGP